jgi:hypothetical protein
MGGIAEFEREPTCYDCVIRNVLGIPIGWARSGGSKIELEQSEGTMRELTSPTDVG